MKILSKLFSKSPLDLLAKGDRHLESESFFDARTCYEDGLQRCSNSAEGQDLADKLKKRIETANYKLAELNLSEAEFAFTRGEIRKAIDNLELVKTLTYDAIIREKAEVLIQQCCATDDNPEEQAKASDCSSCSHVSGSDGSDSPHYDESLPPMEYYDLLIRQLPIEQYLRYSELGEDFACAYIATSQDRHEEALSYLEKCAGITDQDIYYCETGKILHRLGNDQDAEQLLRKAIQVNRKNTLSWYNLALLLIESGRLDECLQVLDTMVAEEYMPGEAMLMRAEIMESTGDHERAINQYTQLLTTPYARTAAEKMYGILLLTDRQNDAAVIFKKYLGKCCH
ncbi:MAG: tetratricopeptide repeat protein [Geobacter sp.]|nr:tetratricopeptide repeat protein [Geobacter sp.]